MIKLVIFDFDLCFNRFAKTEYENSNLFKCSSLNRLKQDKTYAICAFLKHKKLNPTYHGDIQ
jgi:hypothetical protein